MASSVHPTVGQLPGPPARPEPTQAPQLRRVLLDLRVDYGHKEASWGAEVTHQGKDGGL